MMIESDLVLRNRSGGERLRVHPKQARKTLTHLFQVAGVPPWERARLPMLCSRDEVLWVPALGYAAEYLAAPGQDGFEMTWIGALEGVVTYIIGIGLGRIGGGQ